GVAGQRAHEEEDQQHYPQHGRDRLDEPLDDEHRHLLSRWSYPSRWPRGMATGAAILAAPAVLRLLERGAPGVDGVVGRSDHAAEVGSPPGDRVGAYQEHPRRGLPDDGLGLLVRRGARRRVAAGAASEHQLLDAVVLIEAPVVRGWWEGAAREGRGEGEVGVTSGGAGAHQGCFGGVLLDGQEDLVDERPALLLI